MQVACIALGIVGQLITDLLFIAISKWCISSWIEQYIGEVGVVFRNYLNIRRCRGMTLNVSHIMSEARRPNTIVSWILFSSLILTCLLCSSIPLRGAVASWRNKNTGSLCSFLFYLLSTHATIIRLTYYYSLIFHCGVPLECPLGTAPLVQISHTLYPHGAEV